MNRRGFFVVVFDLGLLTLPLELIGGQLIEEYLGLFMGGFGA